MAFDAMVGPKLKMRLFWSLLGAKCYCFSDTLQGVRYFHLGTLLTSSSANRPISAYMILRQLHHLAMNVIYWPSYNIGIGFVALACANGKTLDTCFI